MDKLLRRLLFAALVGLTSFALQPTARGDQCGRSCRRGKQVCAMQARTAFAACVQGCGSGNAATQCQATCRDTLRSSRTACKASRADCATNCATSSPDVADVAGAAPCTTGCGGPSDTCFADVLTAGQTCVQTCATAGGSAVPRCLEQCAATLRGSGAACMAALEGCLTGCQGQVSGGCFDTIAMECTAEPCGPGQPCAQPNEFCSPRCSLPPASGTCFDASTMQCTNQSCSSTQPCTLPNETCVPECPPPPPEGRCFDTITKQCTDESCSPGNRCTQPNQICTLQCPPPPRSGTCFDTSAMQCTNQVCSLDQPCVQPNQRCVSECPPPPTPTPQCNSVPCGGTCALPFVCPEGVPCPLEIPVRLGQCELSAAGSCDCVPAPTPTAGPPTPTPTPQCASATCGGPCVISFPPFPCPLGAVCNGKQGPEEPVLLGQCELTATGSCDCVPVEPTPPPTPTPQCDSVPCGGPCVISFPCWPDGPCPEVLSRLGQCTLDTTGSCHCVPITPPPTPTPTPQCDNVPCGGPCVIPLPCPLGETCPEILSQLGECILDAAGSCQCVPITPPPTPTPTPQCVGNPCGGSCVLPFPCKDGFPCPEFPGRLGQCQVSAAGSCDCLPVPQTPLPTPTPQCAAVPCGGQCVIVPPCPLGEACPNFVLQGECRDDASGTCQCMPSSVPTQTPVPTCTADADCNDDDACTVDRCVNGMCEHVCICLTAAGTPACCPGPSVLCARLCGADASGACGGTCPSGAICESLPAAQASCGCVSDAGGPCGGNIFAPPLVCAPGLLCQQSLPDITGICVKPDCIPFFTAGCSQTSDCCQPCLAGARAPCAVCNQGTCVGTP
jgi:hypothetical protein